MTGLGLLLPWQPRGRSDRFWAVVLKRCCQVHLCITRAILSPKLARPPSLSRLLLLLPPAAPLLPRLSPSVEAISLSTASMDQGSVIGRNENLAWSWFDYQSSIPSSSSSQKSIERFMFIISPSLLLLLLLL